MHGRLMSSSWPQQDLRDESIERAMRVNPGISFMRIAIHKRLSMGYGLLTRRKGSHLAIRSTRSSWPCAVGTEDLHGNRRALKTFACMSMRLVLPQATAAFLCSEPSLLRDYRCG
jgi:hypothetical protein